MGLTKREGWPKLDSPPQIRRRMNDPAVLRDTCTYLYTELSIGQEVKQLIRRSADAS